MERNIPRLLFILLVFFILSTPPPGAAKHYLKWILQQFDKIPWEHARNHCRRWNEELITFTNLEEAQQLVGLHGWIGLYRDSNIWRWTTGTYPAFMLWDEGEPHINHGCALKVGRSAKWKTRICGENYPFICTKTDGILVQEEKTWEEALQHCRELHGDLISLPGKEQRFHLDRKAIREDANTYEVWVGLRFLAGEWLWMNGQAAQSFNLSQCPAPYLHCGAVVHNDTEFKIMDCTEKRNFLCSKKETKHHPE